ncbi:hypothetical protein [Candidatus Aciduliprofundum boonei]|uniref:Uncharacterized protein n=1 Tax=Aciduliprofundum boonei (strain DSM 19572 / T469) TaxID=439481 RepID=D3TA68_ACIB4|nr:hypothetical protein [Candidatus Aciduliprofundum boonei]ADD08997.1 hypothetical protein Aboo_1188 [Aciduliprofundum boonei T469]HII55727.1 hypothetical protein [Candidatus Aciduliprofundum boonei]
MIILSPQVATILSALLLIYIGIVVEKYYVSWSSVYANTLSFLIMLGSINMSFYVFLFLLGYTLLGYISVKLKWKRIFPLFGCKTYGSLVLVLTLGSEGYIFGIYSITSVLISWVSVAIMVHILGYLYVKHSRRRRSKW